MSGFDPQTAGGTHTKHVIAIDACGARNIPREVLLHATAHISWYFHVAVVTPLQSSVNTLKLDKRNSISYDN